MKYLILILLLASPIATAALGEEHPDGKAEAMRYLCTHQSYTLDAVYLKCSEEGMKECDLSAEGMANEFKCWSGVSFSCRIKMDILSTELTNVCTKFLSAGSQ